MNKFTALFTLFLGLTFAFSACDKKEETPAMRIAGTTSKIWKVDRAKDASGDRVKGDAIDGSATFFANGQFSMTDGSANMNGTWTVNGSGTQLTLTQGEMGGAMAWDIQELKDDKMVLKNGAGEIYTFETNN